MGILEIHAGDTLLTELVDHLGKTPSTRPGPWVSAYRLAQWLAANWWRLRCEQWPADGEPDLDWWMTHNMPDAGYGYVWPNIKIWRQDGHIMIKAEPSIDPHFYTRYKGANNSEPIAVTIESFDQTVDAVFSTTKNLLEAAGLHETELHVLLADLEEERTNPDLAKVRELEAINGQDPPYENDP